MARKRDVANNRAGVGPVPGNATRLVSIRNASDFRIGDGEPDVRGWTVRTLSGRSLGAVDDLLIDPDRRQVVMLEIGLQDSDRHALAPIRAAQLDASNKTVLLDSADLDGGAELPSYRRGEPVSEHDERDFDDRYRRAYGGRDGESEEHVRRTGGDADEVVLERRPVVVEEVVVRRKVVDADDAEDPDTLR